MSDDLQEIPPRLKNDLASLYAPPIQVAAKLNQAILNDARVQLSRRSRWRTLRWAGAAAAAACLVLVARIALHTPDSPQEIAASGRVDIVDALKLARQIEAGKGRDINNDGVIDQRDVDALAMAAVQLDQGGIQ